MDREKSLIQVANVIGNVVRKGVTLWADNGHLRYRAPKGALTGDELNQLKALKEQIVAFLERGNGKEASGAGIERRSRLDQAPLTFSQLAYWNLHQLGARHGGSNISNVKRLRGKLNVEASGRGNIRSAQNEALLSQEEKALRQTESEVAEANKNLKPGQAPRTILNKNRPAAGENMAEWEARHSASSDAEWEVIKTPGSSVIVFRVFVGVQVLQLILDAVFAERNAKLARYTWAPYVFIEENDPESSFTVDGVSSWMGFVTTWRKHYITGKHAGSYVEITDDEYKALKDEAEALYGYVDFWGDFVPGLLRTELPIIDHDPNDPNWA